MGYLENNSSRNKADRPKLTLPRTGLDWSIELLAATGLLLGLYHLMVNYPDLPQSIPTHFNFAGEADSWGDKATIWILGAGIIVLYSVLTFTSRIPHLYNYPFQITSENAERQYRIARTFITVLKAEVVWLFASIISGTIDVAFGKSGRLEPSMLFLFLGLILASIIVYFVFARRAR